MSILAISTTPVAISIPFDNATNGFAATEVQSAIEEARNSPAVNFISTAVSTNMSSSTDAVLSVMTYTNSTGAAIKVTADFNGDINIGAVGGVLSVSFYLNAVQVANTLRKMAGDQGTLAAATRVNASTSCKVTIPNGQTLDIRWSVSSGTITAAGRSLRLMKCGDF